MFARAANIQFQSGKVDEGIHLVQDLLDTPPLSHQSHLFTMRVWLEHPGDGKTDW